MWVSRLDFTNDATVIMPVQRELKDQIWVKVVNSANGYDYAEPPVANGCTLRVNTRWPLTLYEVSWALGYY